MEITLSLDEENRTALLPLPPTSTPLTLPSTLNYETLSFTTSLSPSITHLPTLPIITSLITDATLLESPNYPRSHFILPASQTPPSSLLEHLAQEVYAFHTSQLHPLHIDSTRSGAEWWLQIRPSPLNSWRTKSLRSGLSSHGINWHWDKDENLRDVSSGLTIHPHISTVTYLADRGGAAPTVILDSRCDVQTGCADTGEKIDCGHVVFPVVGKHVAFDGGKLHSAVKDFARSGCDDDNAAEGVRVTFLVNVWINHIPFGIERLVEDISKLLSGKVPDGGFDLFSTSSSLPFTTISVKNNSLPKTHHVIGRGGGEIEVLKMTFPASEIKEATEDVFLSYAEGEGGAFFRERDAELGEDEENETGKKDVDVAEDEDGVKKRKVDVILESTVTA